MQVGGDAMSDAKEFQLESVPARARRAREIPTPWVWVEPTVWTERMLTALIEGSKVESGPTINVGPTPSLPTMDFLA